MAAGEHLPISVQPVVSYPRTAEAGKTYLLTVDLHQPADGGEWPYEEEEYAVYCMLDASPLFECRPVGEPAIVLHRFHGTYGPAKFLLKAADEEMRGDLRVTLVSEWGKPLRVLKLPDVRISRGGVRIPPPAPVAHEPIVIRDNFDDREIRQRPVTPTLIVGLGGAGGDILLRVRKRFFEHYGPPEQFPIVSYLWLDTDPHEKTIPNSSAISDQIAFANNEKLLTTVVDTTRYTSNLDAYPEIKRWFYPGLSKLKEMTAGAGQIRAYGRLGFFSHYHEIRNALQLAAARARDLKRVEAVSRQFKLEVDPHVLQVIVVSSLAGGTGSGMFLDLAFLVKDLFAGGQLSTVGILLMPGFYSDNGGDRIDANGYAALKELEHYSSEHDFHAEWPDKSRRIIPGPPFNHTYLIDRTNQAGATVEFSNREVVFNMVADNVFTEFVRGDFASYRKGVRDNLEQYATGLYAFSHLNDRRERVIDQKFTTRYGSFGLASIAVPTERIESACAYRLAADVIGHWAGPSSRSYQNDEFIDGMLKRARLFEGNSREDGRNEKRNDIQHALLDDGRKRGHRLDNLVVLSLQRAVEEVKEGSYQRRGVTTAEHLRGAVEAEVLKLGRQHPEVQQWGDYARAVHFNAEALTDTAARALREVMEESVNQGSWPLHDAAAALIRVNQVLRYEERHYLPAFDRNSANLVQVAEETRKELEELLSKIAARERRFILRFLRPIGSDLAEFVKLGGVYLRALLLTQVQQAAAAVCWRLIELIGAEDGDRSLVGDLYERAKLLDRFRARLLDGHEHFSRPERDGLTISLYDPSDIEQIYLPRYLGDDEAARAQTQSIGEELLRELGTTVTELPDLLSNRSVAVEARLINFARQPFRTLPDDVDVLESLWQKYPDASERESRVRHTYNAARFWLNGGARPRSFLLTPEQHKVMVSLPRDSRDPLKVEEFESMLKAKLQGPGEPLLSALKSDSRSEIVFYSEAGGLPINWANSVQELRRKYLRLRAEGQELHIEADDFKFSDIVVLNDVEWQEQETTYECFLLGIILGRIAPQRDHAGRVAYVFKAERERDKNFYSLGVASHAIEELAARASTRDSLLKLIYEDLWLIYGRLDSLARLYALLTWYARDVYPERRTTTSDGAENIEQSPMCRVVYSHLGRIDEQQSGRYDADVFRARSQRYIAEVDSFSLPLIDGNRQLRPEVIRPGAAE